MTDEGIRSAAWPSSASMFADSRTPCCSISSCRIRARPVRRSSAPPQTQRGGQPSPPPSVAATTREAIMPPPALAISASMRSAFSSRPESLPPTSLSHALSSRMERPLSASEGASAIARSDECRSPNRRSSLVMSGAACSASRFTTPSLETASSALLPSPVSALKMSRPRAGPSSSPGSKSTRTGRRQEGQRAWPALLKEEASARSQQPRQ
mmetsp:Transcript_47705/g.153671  ORF Transcript_47705/g.153671 Transcript_47705/m.153671 type:complete len:211 (+) Transcript_47705:1392-2024(+)